MAQPTPKSTPGPWKVGGKCAEWDVSPPPRAAVTSHQPVTARGRTDPICIVVQRDKRSYGDGDAELDANVRLIAAAPEMLAALQAVNNLVSEAAMTGFNCHDGDWAERLFHSQQATSRAICKAEGR